MSRYLGVDLHRNRFTVCTQLESGRQYVTTLRLSALLLIVVAGCATNQTLTELNVEHLANYQRIGIHCAFQPGITTYIDIERNSLQDEQLLRLQRSLNVQEAVLNEFLAKVPGLPWKTVGGPLCVEAGAEARKAHTERAFDQTAMKTLAEQCEVDALLLISIRSHPRLSKSAQTFPLDTRALMIDLFSGDVLWEKAIAEGPQPLGVTSSFLGTVSISRGHVVRCFESQIPWIVKQLASDFIGVDVGAARPAGSA